MPTGTGKTLVAAEVIRRMLTKEMAASGQFSCLFLAHREELLNQARATIEQHCQTECELELGHQRASEKFPADVLLASVQTMISGRNGSRRMLIGKIGTNAQLTEDSVIFLAHRESKRLR